MRRPGRYAIDDLIGATVLVVTLLYFAGHIIVALAR